MKPPTKYLILNSESIDFIFFVLNYFILNTLPENFDYNGTNHRFYFDENNQLLRDGIIITTNNKVILKRNGTCSNKKNFALNQQVIIFIIKE